MRWTCHPTRVPSASRQTGQARSVAAAAMAGGSPVRCLMSKLVSRMCSTSVIPSSGTRLQPDLLPCRSTTILWNVDNAGEVEEVPGPRQNGAVTDDSEDHRVAIPQPQRVPDRTRNSHLTFGGQPSCNIHGRPYSGVFGRIRGARRSHGLSALSRRVGPANPSERPNANHRTGHHPKSRDLRTLR